jgi:hypothetical protein
LAEALAAAVRQTSALALPWTLPGGATTVLVPVALVDKLVELMRKEVQRSVLNIDDD